MIANAPKERRRAPFGVVPILFIVLAPLAPLLARQSPQPAAPARGGVDWIFVIDTSESMIGAGGTRNIFEPVKAEIRKFIAQTQPGDTVTIYRFDNDTYPVTDQTVTIISESDKLFLFNKVNALAARGARTHLGKALSDALVRAGQLGNRPDAKERAVSIFLLSDGIEDTQGLPNVVSIPSAVKLVPENKPYVYYISLGSTPDPTLRDTLNRPEFGGRAQTRDNPDLTDMFPQRPTPPPAPSATPTPPPAPINLGASPATVDFGEVEAGESSDARTLKLSSSTPTRVSLSLAAAGSGISLAEPSGPVEIKAGEDASVEVRLAAEPGAEAGPRVLKLSVAPVGAPPEAAVTQAEAQLSVSVKRVPFWWKVLKWIGLLLVLLVLLVFGYTLLVKQEMPWTLWGRWKERKHLEGEIEIIRPPTPQPEDAIVGLSALRAERAALSSLVPGGATGDSDAELSTYFKDGVKRIRLARTRGEVRVRSTPVAITDLYDGYEIELGAAKVRFNWTGHEEPIAADPES